MHIPLRHLPVSMGVEGDWLTSDPMGIRFRYDDTKRCAEMLFFSCRRQ